MRRAIVDDIEWKTLTVLKRSTCVSDVVSVTSSCFRWYSRSLLLCQFRLSETPFFEAVQLGKYDNASPLQYDVAPLLTSPRRIWRRLFSSYYFKTARETRESLCLLDDLIFSLSLVLLLIQSWNLLWVTLKTTSPKILHVLHVLLLLLAEDVQFDSSPSSSSSAVTRKVFRTYWSVSLLYHPFTCAWKYTVKRSESGGMDEICKPKRSTKSPFCFRWNTINSNLSMRSGDRIQRHIVSLFSIIMNVMRRRPRRLTEHMVSLILIPAFPSQNPLRSIASDFAVRCPQSRRYPLVSSQDHTHKRQCHRTGTPWDNESVPYESPF